MEKLKRLKGISKNFYLLAFGNSTSNIGTVVFNTILAWWLIQKTGSAKAFGYVSASGIVPLVIFNVFSGVIVDRKNKKRLLIFTDLISSIVCIFVGYMVSKEIVNLPLLMLASFLLGACSSLFSPAIKAILPQLVKKDNILTANSINTTLNQVVGIISPIIAAVFINNLSLGLSIAFYFNGVTFFISMISECMIKYEFVENKEKKKITFKKDINEAFTYVKDRKWLYRLLIIAAMMNLLFASYNVLMPLYLKEVYNDNGSIYALSMSVNAVFGILGGCYLTVSNQKFSFKNLKKNLIFVSLSIVAIQLVKSKTMLFVILGINTFYLTVFNTIFFSLMQIKIDKHMMGRVFSFISMIVLSLKPLGNLMYGILGEYIINYVYIISGGLMVLLSLLVITNEDEEKCKEVS